jgi:hypothetical protein
MVSWIEQTLKKAEKGYLKGKYHTERTPLPLARVLGFS